MPELSPDALTAMPFWGSIQSSVTERATTAQLWQGIRDAADSFGMNTPGATLAGVNELRGYAAQIRNASDRLERAQSDEADFSRLSAPAPYSRDQATMNAAPMWQVQFEHTTYTGQAESTDWRTLMYRGNTPPTVGDLRTDIEQAGEDFADEYQMEHIGTGRVRIVRV